VTLDIGEADNVHPPDKQTVGARLAVAALAKVYGKPVEYSGPLFRQAATDGSAMRVYFDHATGLRAHGDALVGFEVAGKDHKFYPAKAEISDSGAQKGSVLATSDSVSGPMYVRYAWQGVTAANLYNAADLPAPTFTSEP
jgi:sialate O-acetylesterase